MPNYYEFRCKNCNKKLGRVAGDSEIVCPRCSGLNELTFSNKMIKYTPKIKQHSSGQNSQFGMGFKPDKDHAEQLKRVEKRTSSGTTFR